MEPPGPAGSGGSLVATGRIVVILADGDYPAGEHQLEWNGRSDTGHEVAAGVCFATVRTRGASESRKLVLLR